MSVERKWRDRLFRAEARMTPEESRGHERRFFFITAALLLALVPLCLMLRDALGNMTKAAVILLVVDSLCLAILGLMHRKRKE